MATSALILPLLSLTLSAPASVVVPVPDETITTETLLHEMVDLGALARLPEPEYTTVQFSSYDRRSIGPEDPDWFSNADGFGREPIPGFMEVLEEPGENGQGLYLVAHHEGPGAIVRGWSAGMGGVWKVHLDGAAEPVFEGSGYDFLARRSERFFKDVGLEIDAGDAFVQEDADYFPMPFSEELRVTWRGTLQELHFYHLQVRCYEEGTKVATFTGEDIATYAAAVKRTAKELTLPRNLHEGTAHTFSEIVEPLATKSWTPEVSGSGAITELRVKLDAGTRLREALRGCLLRIAFDGSQRAQVEAPVGDFFGSGPGLNPFSSLPMSVEQDGTMVCRFVMPYAREVEIEVMNATDFPVTAKLDVTISPWTFDESTLCFRARWRIAHELVSACQEKVMDFPYLVMRGRGRLVGAATYVANPAGGPMASGNWWGEGDEKILVDDEPTPSTFGTGSEDFYNYSWSRPDLFDHPYCGQPLDGGPDTAGYVSNHRFLVTDAIPFQRFLAFYMELWQHNASPQLSYGALAYAYARPGVLDDHRALTGTDLVISPMPPVTPLAVGGSSGATFYHAEEQNPRTDDARTEMRDLELAPRNEALFWEATEGHNLTFTLPLSGAGDYEINFVGLHQPGGPVLRCYANGDPLLLRDQAETVELTADFAHRMLNVRFARTSLPDGPCEFRIECLESGTLAIDYFWVRRYEPPMKISGAFEGESLKILSQSTGISVGPQRLEPDRWSDATHLWVQAVSPGQFVELLVPVEQAGRYRLKGYFTKSYDYGIVQVYANGKPVGEPIDTFNKESRSVVATGPIDLGELELEGDLTLRLEVTGTNPSSGAPHYFFGLDCVVLEPR